MSGLTWEWIWDWWSDTLPCCSTNPVGPASYSHNHRVLRGGSHANIVANSRVSHRSGTSPNSQGNIGIRLVSSAR